MLSSCFYNSFGLLYLVVNKKIFAICCSYTRVLSIISKASSKLI
nr:MAG TPA: hypothetical protein [Caudoviricetes sp.]